MLVQHPGQCFVLCPVRLESGREDQHQSHEIRKSIQTRILGEDQGEWRLHQCTLMAQPKQKRGVSIF